MGAITGAVSFKTQAGMLSGPEALYGLISNRSLRTLVVMVISVVVIKIIPWHLY